MGRVVSHKTPKYVSNPQLFQLHAHCVVKVTLPIIKIVLYRKICYMQEIKTQVNTQTLLKAKTTET